MVYGRDMLWKELSRYFALFQRHEGPSFRVLSPRPTPRLAVTLIAHFTSTHLLYVGSLRQRMLKLGLYFRSNYDLPYHILNPCAALGHS
jgi:hypothetical protein